MEKRACCLNCAIPNGPYIYCDNLKRVIESDVDNMFDVTGETMACVLYRYAGLPSVNDRMQPQAG